MTEDIRFLPESDSAGAEPRPVTIDGADEADPEVILAAVARPPVRVEAAKPTPPEAPPEPPRRALPIRVAVWLASVAEWCFGLVCMMVGLAFLASIPILQFISLGYLLEASGRVTRSGRLRDGFIGIRPAARIGGAIAGGWGLLLPARITADMAYSAQLIQFDGQLYRNWRFGSIVLSVILVVHIVTVLCAGGRLRYYLWPLYTPFALPVQWFRGRRLSTWLPPAILLSQIRRGKVFERARDATWDFAARLQIPYFFWLGLRGFAGAVTWLFIPILLLMGSSLLPPGPAFLSGLLGAMLFSVLLLYLPFLQAHFAAERSMVAMFDVPAVRDMFKRAPIAFWTALLVTLVFALPLYLLKIELTPQEVVWLPSLAFVAFIFPSRLLTGWALGRAVRRREPRHGLWRWVFSWGMLPLTGAYVLIAYATQFLSWYGTWSLLEQHAFLTPAPFFSQ